jgi:hypothetical protein
MNCFNQFNIMVVCYVRLTDIVRKVLVRTRAAFHVRGSEWIRRIMSIAVPNADAVGLDLHDPMIARSVDFIDLGLLYLFAYFSPGGGR